MSEEYDKSDLDTVWAAIDDLNQGLNQLHELTRYAFTFAASRYPLAMDAETRPEHVMADEWGK